MLTIKHGSVLSAIRSTIYINSSLDLFDNSTLISLYAKNLAIARNSINKDQVSQKLLKEVDKIADSSVKDKFTSKTSNHETAIFCVDSAEWKWQPIIDMSGPKPSCKRNANILGVAHDSFPLVNVSTNTADPYLYGQICYGSFHTHFCVLARIRNTQHLHRNHGCQSETSANSSEYSRRLPVQ